MHLYNLSIKHRMILSFLLIIILFTGFAMTCIYQMNVLNGLTETLYTHPLQVSNAALEAKAGVLAMHRSTKDISTATTQADIALGIEKVRHNEQRVYQELALIKQFILGQEGKQLIEETIEFFGGWRPIRLEIQHFVLQGDTESANRITREKGADYVIRLEKRMEELARYARNKADGFMAKAEKVQQQVHRDILASIVLFVVLALLISFFLSSSILTAITELQKTMERIASTGDLEKTQPKGNNEISELARHFNILIQKLQEQLWLQTEENALKQTLSGDLGFDAILEKGCRHLCRSLNACAGAVYTFDSEKNLCRLSHYFALPGGSQFSDSFFPGQGIVGQVAEEKKEILLTRPGETEVLVNAGALNQAPHTLMALPMMHKNTLYGVFEIASFESVNSIQQQYLRSSARIMAVLLFAAGKNEQVKRLLADARKTNEQLRAQTEQLQALNTEFQQQSTELNQQNIELEYRRRQVEEANRLKSQFLSNMSHELRTPLNSVNTLSRVLISQAGERLSPEENSYLEIIERNGKHLLSLINDILDLSKIEAGKMDLHLTRFSLAAAIDNVVETLVPLARKKGIALEAKLPGSISLIESDEAKVHQVLENIIANAVKYTEKGSVCVSVLEHQNYFDIKVEDTGIGISTKDLPTIFEEFRQADGTTTRKFEGTGLGLAIAYKAARLLGGDVKVSSVIGQGSVFTVQIPVSCDSAVPASSSAVDEPALPDLPPDRQGHAILIVDDDPEMRGLLAHAFQEAGYPTLTAATGREALKLAGTRQPLAITLDVVMPDMDGWEVLVRLKENPDTAPIPVVIISVTDDRDTGSALGAVGYITKPVDYQKLIREIKKIHNTLPVTVMLVDDNDADRNQAALCISEAGMRVMAANSGRQCLEMLETDKPDVMVLDLVMPGMDGFELVKAVRGNPETADLPILILTAKDLSPGEKAVLEANVSTILIKDHRCPKRLRKDIKTILNRIHTSPKSSRNHPDGSKRILLVEDNDAAVIQVKTALESGGIAVDAVSDGQQALDYLDHSM
ncbi:response regulator, partial [Desulfobacter sp.]|uniref:response regulator n=1 Tax=Desulfobacter sp. TaxID=2294 RepID=UPI003D127EE8